MTAARTVGPGHVFRRVGMIVIAVLIIAQVVVLTLASRSSDVDFRAVPTLQAPEERAPIASEAGPFRDLAEGLHPVSRGQPSPHIVVPTRVERRVRRAYDGAPPRIPHPVTDEMDRTQDCAPCHTFGGYNPAIRTYTPRAPHTRMSNCLQCHVQQGTGELFVETDWVPMAWPEIGGEVGLIGAPPGIPHVLQMREPCLSCHGGASAAPDIRTTHPERFNCRQCHLPVEVFESEFTRGSSPGGGP